MVHTQPYSFFGTIGVQPQPLVVLLGNDAVHVLCGEVDGNFNGTQDAGDTPASWVRIPLRNGSLDQQSAQTLRFAWGEGIGFPSRPAFDSDGQTLYIEQRGRIRSFDTRSQTLRRDTLLLIDSLARSTFNTTGTVSALSIDGASGRLFVSLRGRSTSAVVEVDIASSRVVTRYPAGVFVQQTIPYITSTGKRGVAILNEGSFGTNTSTLMLARSPQEMTTLSIGNTGNHLLRVGDEIIATMNGSHELKVINLNEERIARTIPVGTTGFNGPREAAYIRQLNQYVVTSYDGKIRFFDATTGVTLGTVNTNSKSEGLAIVPNNSLLVSDAFAANSFTSASTLSQISFITNSVRDNSLALTRSTIAPNPVSGTARITLQASLSLGYGDITLSLVNTLGAHVATLPFERHENTIEAALNVEELGLAGGMYFLQLRTAQGMTALPLFITR
ncbi:MAG: hypothetical protein H9535_17385 [Ignavibacteria bacterium]|nr:hypothetical protein [Ignavibacteria bacterium]